MRITRKLVAGAGVTAVVLGGVGGVAHAATKTPRPQCTADDVSFYFGGFSQGIGSSTFAITLLAHDGVSCALSDRPTISLGGPSSKPIPLQINGRGGRLVLTPETPLHAVVSTTSPDTTKDTSKVSSLTLRMPGGGSRATYFGVPGVTELATVNGVLISSWSTGIGPVRAKAQPESRRRA